MPGLPLLLANALALLGALVYALIGLRYARLAARAPMQTPFALFWLGIAFYGLADGAWGLAVPLLDPPPAFGIVVLHLKILSGCAAFFGLVYYLAYLYTGRRRLVWPILALYVVIFAVVTYSYAARVPIGQEVRTWGGGLTYANEGGALSNVAYALLFAPPLAGALAYGALLPRAATREQRLRILATSAAFAVLFGGMLLGWMTNVVPLWPLLEKGLAVVAGLIVFGAAPREAREPPQAGPTAPT